MEESGFPGFDVTTWWGMFVPAGTPTGVVDKLSRETRKIMTSPDVDKKLHAIGTLPLISTPAELADVIKKETPSWTPDQSSWHQADRMNYSRTSKQAAMLNGSAPSVFGKHQSIDDVPANDEDPQVLELPWHR